MMREKEEINVPHLVEVDWIFLKLFQMSKGDGC